MPRIEIKLDRYNFDGLDPEARDGIADFLRQMVADGLDAGPEPLSADDVEVLWSVFEEGQGAIDFCVDVLYSVTADFNPTEEQRTKLAEQIRDWLVQTPYLAQFGFDSVASWIRPQHEAVFRWEARIRKSG